MMQSPRSVDGAATPALDLSELLTLFAGDKVELAAFCVEVADAIHKVGVQLSHACGRSDWKDARERAHKLKGLCGNVGAHELYRKSASFELLVVNDPELARSHLPEVLGTCRHVSEKLKNI
jgi:HPt (histidine-containing phosphotransfer) domain-containing protein